MFAKVEVIPFTIVERVFPVDVATFELIVENVVVESTPFTSDDRVISFDVVATVKVLFEMIELVAVTPLIVVVSVLPERV